MTRPTIFDSYRVVEEYFQIIERIDGGLPPISVNIKPIDVFILQQIAAFYAVPPLIVDLASLPTKGVSLALWSKKPSDIWAILPGYLTSQLHNDDVNEHHRIISRIREMFGYLLFESPDIPLDDPAIWQEIVGVLQQKTPILVMIAYAHSSHTDILRELNTLLRLMPSAVFVLLPMGKINTPTAFAAAQLCSMRSDRQVLLMPETSFTLFSSELGFIYPKDDTYLLPTLERIKQLFAGNFDFLALTEMNFALQQAYQRIEKDLEAEKKSATENLLAGRNQEHAQYHGLIGYFRGIYHAFIPLRLRLLLRNIRILTINALRSMYHFLIPLRLRLKLRDIRVAFIGR